MTMMTRKPDNRPNWDGCRILTARRATEILSLARLMRVNRRRKRIQVHLDRMQVALGTQSAKMSSLTCEEEASYLVLEKS